MSLFDIGLGGLGSAAIGYTIYDKGKDALSEFGSNTQAGTQQAWEQFAPNFQFKPFTVTTGTGSTAGYNNGQLSMQGSSQEQALQNQLFGGARQFYGQAMQSNPMFQQQANMFGGMASGYQPSQFNYQNIGAYNPQAVQGMGGYGTSFRPDQLSAYGFGNAGVNALSNQAMGMGMQQLGQSGQAPSDIEALRRQTAGQAQGMLGGLGMSQADRESDVYSRIRAMQTPEEERQQLALEERLAAQGRLGISTAQFGGTPEQMALDKARAEAQNSAAFQAMQQAGTESDRAYQQATGLAGLTGNLAGQSSQLQSQAQQRATELANMGMSAQQINSQLQSEGLSRAMQAGGYNREGLMMQDQLTQSSFNRALQSGQFGREGQALASQLASQQQARDLASMGFRNQQDQLAQQMRTQDIQNQLALAGGSQGALAQMLGLQQGYGQLGSSMFTQAYLPQSQMLNAYQQALAGSQQEQQAMQQYGTTGMESYLTGLDAQLQAQLGKANLTGNYLTTLAEAFKPTINPVTGEPVSGTGMFGDLKLGDIYDPQKGWFSGFGG